MKTIKIAAESCIVPGFVPVPADVPNDPAYRELNTLGQSEAVHGRWGRGGKVEILYGAGLLRAALELSPSYQLEVTLHDFNDEEAFTWAQQTASVYFKPDAIELARSFKDAHISLGMTITHLGKLLGMKRSAMANIIRLLDLDPKVQMMVKLGVLSYGKAQHLIALSKSHQVEYAQRCINGNWTATQLFYASRGASQKAGKQPITESRASISQPRKSSIIQYLEQNLSEVLGYPLSVNESPDGSGFLEFKFHSMEALQGLFIALRKRAKRPDLYDGSLIIPYRTIEQMNDLLEGLTHSESDFF